MGLTTRALWLVLVLLVALSIGGPASAVPEVGAPVVGDGQPVVELSLPDAALEGSAPATRFLTRGKGGRSFDVAWCRPLLPT